jgi:histidyl-tRNA synthetase
VGGGGRYDGLIEQLGGPPTPGVGWAAGVERMLLAGGERPVAPPAVDLFVAIAPHGPRGSRQVAFKLANQARRAGLSAQLELAGRGLKGQLKHADRLGARYVAIIDDQMHISLRNMEAGDQTELEPASVIPTILRGSRVA